MPTSAWMLMWTLLNDNQGKDGEFPCQWSLFLTWNRHNSVLSPSIWPFPIHMDVQMCTKTTESYDSNIPVCKAIMNFNVHGKKVIMHLINIKCVLIHKLNATINTSYGHVNWLLLSTSWGWNNKESKARSWFHFVM